MISTSTTKINSMTFALIAAAGQGTRLGANMPKAMVRLAGRTLLDHSVAAMEASGAIQEILVIIRPEMEAQVKAEIGARARIVYGAGERADSVWEGLKAIQAQEGRVLIHDAARALTPPAMIARVAAAQAPAVIPVVPVSDTIKEVCGSTVQSTPDRSTLRAVQTPQAFDLRTLREVNAKYFAQRSFEATDDASLMEWAGIPVECVEGDPLAFKITTSLDLLLAQTLIDAQEHQ
ncbi:2-C-methyl-D-erythritol 4-phosphate cytidylyltransferase [Corynebacterium sp. 153RC1]|uniref:2-C-methyl-D-erythritol 4-phosphate cytidylyltransferase n=1 Tax=unclassified Corynebacterium TaxID=2624378 RepID=UPI00211D0981|nr:MULTISPECIES: 2-C-methyl-D-erythritol 4-phosphate cytidylyltransferase [unclassified Corynebacterium]MCQ9371490.1 2-C-methyl-D-erythritol 4-phosphate cytidylyltransferase [Corynebacterium sp. 35RC1]MCQ9353070.1 2-C-methyl-D-erythritol 4-phosphate cytidylyltransferase [Corynebacterium sp. 209RC1]MCQ9355274.1 2-C-methyl-D-erythritol 4-phosphate cytidylyltransferase [Corynebacterium sp. 1222RC1]MCQ9357552.1 2-C-methyl-D-erythritol 4-phosphate cytidylyltransferase [Corynebacterium sp. 122RC1]MC